MRTQKEEWVSFIELARLFQLPAMRVSAIVYRYNLETKSDPVDMRKKLVKLSDFQKAIGK